MEWITVKKRFPKEKKVLAICVSIPGILDHLRHDGWFLDTIYSCMVYEERFIIESHGPELPATHWMPLPEPPKVNDGMD